MSTFKPTIKNSEGVIIGEEVHIEGDIVIGAESDPAQQADHCRALGAEYLAQRNFADAVLSYKKAVQVAEAQHGDYYRLALASLGARRPRKLSPVALKEIEAYVRLSSERAPLPHYLLFLAFLKYDYYVINGLRDVEPGYQTLSSRALAEIPDLRELSMLLDCLPISNDNPVFRAIGSGSS